MKSFTELFHAEPEAKASAHGRVNLIGEHTDYNGGFVLPVLIPQVTTIELRTRKDRLVRAFSESIPAQGICEYEIGSERRLNLWVDYLQGVTSILLQKGFAVRGFEARIASSIPIGSGVASSAALEISLLRALREVYRLDLDDRTLAWIGQSAESDFVGARVGIMDQMSASIGKEDAALFIDTRSLECRLVPVPPDLEIVVIHSGIFHENRDGAYNKRREECEHACGLLRVQQLRDLRFSDLPAVEQLPEPFAKRARHVITENERVLEAVSALQRTNLQSFGKLLNLSHQSMRDDFEISTPEVDLLVHLAQKEPHVYGARMTGGGFGGCVIIASKRGSASAIAGGVVSSYFEATGKRAAILQPGHANAS